MEKSTIFWGGNPRTKYGHYQVRKLLVYQRESKKTLEGMDDKKLSNPNQSHEPWLRGDFTVRLWVSLAKYAPAIKENHIQVPIPAGIWNIDMWFYQFQPSYNVYKRVVNFKIPSGLAGTTCSSRQISALTKHQSVLKHSMKRNRLATRDGELSMVRLKESGGSSPVISECLYPMNIWIP